MRPPILLAALALALAGGACSRGGPNAGEGRGILVIAIDGLRADRLHVSGYDRETTISIDALAKQSVRFTQAWAAAPWLLPSHIALLTGCDPAIAKRVLPPEIPPSTLTTWHVPEDAPSLAKALLAKGWSTALFPDSPDLAPVFGIGAGFGEIQAIEPIPDAGVVGLENVGKRLDQWIRNRSSDENWFAYLELHDLVHIWDHGSDPQENALPTRPGHDVVPPVSVNDRAFFALPYSRWWPHLPLTISEYEARYDGTLRKLDFGLKRLLTNPRISAEHTTIVLVGTYGTGFGESGMYLDSGRLADVDLHVPLILRPAKRIHDIRPAVITAPVGLYDLAPTLLVLEGYDIPEGMQGQSLAPLLRGGTAERDFVVSGCGLQPGWVAMNERYCFERTWPGQCETPSLVVGWFGDNVSHHDDVREWLHDREKDPSLGHLGVPAADDGRVRERLVQSAENWLSRVKSVRAQWQKAPPTAGAAGAAPPKGEGQ